MAHSPHHVHLIKEIADQFGPVLKNSPQAVYIYLDDEHKICNQKFADLVGYKSVQEWVENLYPVSDIEESGQKKVIAAYMDASRKLKAAKIEATVVRKDGKKFKTEIIMAPISYKDEVFVIHFITVVR